MCCGPPRTIRPRETRVPRPHFGGGNTAITSLTRQSYPEIVAERAAVVPKLEEKPAFISAEMVALSPAACGELGIELTEEDRTRPTLR